MRWHVLHTHSQDLHTVYAPQVCDDCLLTDHPEKWMLHSNSIHVLNNSPELPSTQVPSQARVNAPLAVECQGGGGAQIARRCAPLLCTKHASLCSERPCSVRVRRGSGHAVRTAHTRSNPKPSALGRALTTVCAQVARVLGNFRRRL